MDYHRTGFIIARFFQSQSVSSLYACLCKSYANTILRSAMHTKMLERSDLATQWTIHHYIILGGGESEH